MLFEILRKETMPYSCVRNTNTYARLCMYICLYVCMYVHTQHKCFCRYTCIDIMYVCIEYVCMYMLCGYSEYKDKRL